MQIDILQIKKIKEKAVQHIASKYHVYIFVLTSAEIKVVFKIITGDFFYLLIDLIIGKVGLTCQLCLVPSD